MLRLFRRYATKRPFDKILIANRGEITCRVIDTCKAMGISTVSVYSDVDALSKHVRMADEAHCIGGAPSSDSYLRADRIIEVAKATGAQAVHPGYGFLSENAAFAHQLDAHDIRFIGPPSRAIELMGDKIMSKKVASEAGVSVIPGYLGEVADEEALLKTCHEIGYPVMIKASAGGGGKGMRIATNDEEAVSGYKQSKEEAKASFGDDRILIEKFISRGRHIEVQVMGDQHGNVVYFPERECSIQRRNQKVVEEAPSTFISAETRKAMGEQAVALAKAVGYTSAGTVEFLVDEDQRFYFLEMNTRLQVEHPITEMITKVDLVKHMIESAANIPLSISQSDIGIHGWAIESRVYAEDPLRGFLPSIGTLSKYQEPPDARCDSGILDGSEISVHYDPMICKLVSHGTDREQAIERMNRALDRYVIRGVQHNINFLRAVMDNTSFRSGDTTTKFIEEQYADGFNGYAFSEEDKLDAVCMGLLVHSNERYRLTGYPEAFETTVRMDAGPVSCLVIPGEEATRMALMVDGEVKVRDVYCPFNPAASLVEARIVDREGEEEVASREVATQVVKRRAAGVELIVKGTQVSLEILPEHISQLRALLPEKVEADTSHLLLSPMPGMMYDISVQVGDKVAAGQPVCVVEAMKMRNVLTAPKDGIIKSIPNSAGHNVQVGDILIELEP